MARQRFTAEEIVMKPRRVEVKVGSGRPTPRSASVAWAYQPRSNCIQRQFDAVSDIQFFEYVVEVYFYCSLGEGQLAGHLGVSHSGGDISGDLRFSWREDVNRRGARARRQSFLQSWRHPDHVIGDGADRALQGLRSERFLNDGASSPLKSRDRVLLVLTPSQNDDLRQGRKGRDVVHHPAIHLEIEQQNIAGCRLNERPQLIRSFGLSDDLEVGSQFE